MKTKQRRPEEIQADILLLKVRELNSMTPKQKLAYARKQLNDANVNIGYQTAMLVVMIEMMEYWEEDDEHMKDFIARSREFFEVFRSGDKEDEEQFLQWMEELKQRTGYSPYLMVKDSLDEVREQNGYEPIN